MARVLFLEQGRSIPRLEDIGDVHRWFNASQVLKTNVTNVYKFLGFSGSIYAQKNIESLTNEQINSVIDLSIRGVLDIGRVYLSGAITGNDDAGVEFNAGEDRVRDFGFECFNPMTLKGKYRTEEDYMRHDIMELMKCEFIYFVNDISTSKGAKVETQVALACGIKELKL